MISFVRKEVALNTAMMYGADLALLGTVCFSIFFFSVDAGSAF